MLPNSDASTPRSTSTPRPTVGAVELWSPLTTTGGPPVTGTFSIVYCSSVDVGRCSTASGRPRPSAAHMPRSTSLRAPRPSGRIDPQLRQLAVHDVDDGVTGRRPLGHADRDGWIALERDLSRPGAIGADHPQIGVSAVVGQVDELRAVRTHRRRLHLTGLLGHPRHRLACSRPADPVTGHFQMSDSLRMRQTTRRPDACTSGSTNDTSPDVICESVRAIQLDDAQIERRRVRQRASRRRAVDEPRSVGQPRDTAHERRARNRPALTAAQRERSTAPRPRSSAPRP